MLCCSKTGKWLTSCQGWAAAVISVTIIYIKPAVMSFIEEIIFQAKDKWCRSNTVAKIKLMSADMINFDFWLISSFMTPRISVSLELLALDIMTRGTLIKISGISVWSGCSFPLAAFILLFSPPSRSHIPPWASSLCVLPCLMSEIPVIFEDLCRSVARIGVLCCLGVGWV